MPLLPPPRRIVTGHGDSGNATFVSNSEIPTEEVGKDKFQFAVLWETHQFPAGNNEFEDPIKQKTKSLANSNGVVLRVVDFQPKTKTVSALEQWTWSRRVP